MQPRADVRREWQVAPYGPAVRGVLVRDHGVGARGAAPPGLLEERLLDFTRDFLGAEPGKSRGFLLTSPAIGPWAVALYFAETMVWNGRQLLAGARPNDPPLIPLTRAAPRGTGAHAMEFPEFCVEIGFAPAADYVDLITTVTNQTRTRGAFKASSCFSLTSHPLFYDGEMLRTYQLTGGGVLETLRRMPRTGDCVRWIAASDFSHHGGEPRAGVMAVISRDGRWTFASARVEHNPADPAEVIGNRWLNCVHTDVPVSVPAGGSRATTQRLYFVAGGLDVLAGRLERDFGLKVHAAEEAHAG